LRARCNSAASLGTYDDWMEQPGAEHEPAPHEVH
jgi:hypothetical protein